VSDLKGKPLKIEKIHAQGNKIFGGVKSTEKNYRFGRL